ncbi:MAG TPA: hypothetical protein VF013_05520 [Candidatus Limnocylindria bacterium]
MDFSKLSSNDKLAAYGAIASIIGPILSSFGFGFGVGWLTLLLALAMLFIVFQPQIAPQTQLPGTKGSLMVVVGGIAAVSAALALLTSLGWFGLFGANIVWALGWLIGIAGGLLMGWAGWQAFQAEGGKFQVGTTASAAPAATPPGSPAAPAASAAAMASEPARSEPMTNEPAADASAMSEDAATAAEDEADRGGMG